MSEPGGPTPPGHTAELRAALQGAEGRMEHSHGCAAPSSAPSHLGAQQQGLRVPSRTLGFGKKSVFLSVSYNKPFSCTEEGGSRESWGRRAPTGRGRGTPLLSWGGCGLLSLVFLSPSECPSVSCEPGWLGCQSLTQHSQHSRGAGLQQRRAACRRGQQQASSGGSGSRTAAFSERSPLSIHCTAVGSSPHPVDV